MNHDSTSSPENPRPRWISPSSASRPSTSRAASSPSSFAWFPAAWPSAAAGSRSRTSSSRRFRIQGEVFVCKTRRCAGWRHTSRSSCRAPSMPFILIHLNDGELARLRAEMHAPVVRGIITSRNRQDRMPVPQRLVRRPHRQGAARAATPAACTAWKSSSRAMKSTSRNRSHA